MILRFILPTKKQLAVHLLTTDLINWNNADLRGAYLTGANLAGAYLTGANLTGADLTGANLRGANLTDANLTGANLTDADLTDANLTGANLTDADLTDANLTDAYLTGANLRGADLTGANLWGADLTGAYLTGADLRGAYLTGADMARHIIDYGVEPRGYRRVLFFDGKDCHIMAGCRYFSFEESVNHWSDSEYPYPGRGADYLRLVNRMKEDAVIKGWVK